MNGLTYIIEDSTRCVIVDLIRRFANQIAAPVSTAANDTCALPVDTVLPTLRTACISPLVAPVAGKQTQTKLGREI